jgi:hypothetical protein
MPQLPEADIPLVGTALQVERLTKYDNEAKKATDIPDGVRVLVNSSLQGFASVKIPQKAFEADPTLLPGIGQSVAYIVRHGAWARGEQGNVFVTFVRSLTPGDLDQIASVVQTIHSSGAEGKRAA